MVDDSHNVIPLWRLATHQETVPSIGDNQAMTPQRLDELRTVLAAMADNPIATLEAHPLPSQLDRSRGISLGAASPLATHLSQLVKQSGETAAAGETLYRMVVPAKFAAQVGGGLVTPMVSKTGSGVHSPLVGSSRIVGHAKFKPVTTAGTFTLAAPLIMTAVAAGVSLHAERQRQQSLAKITELLEKLHAEALRQERADLKACWPAIDKATAILLDGGEVGHSLGLGDAVRAIGVALERAEDRLKEWQSNLDKIGDRPVEIGTLRKAFSGIDKPGGEFRTHLELAELAVALEKRAIVLQAVEHAQKDPSNPFERFVATLRTHQERVIALEDGINDLKRRIGKLRLDRSHGIRDGIGVTAGDVDHLLRTAYQLRDEFDESVLTSNRRSDFAIEIARSADGSVVVFPAVAV